MAQPATHPLATATENVRVEVVEPGSSEDFSKPGGADHSPADPNAGPPADSVTQARDATSATDPATTPAAPAAPASDPAAQAPDSTSAAAPTEGVPVADPTPAPSIGSPAPDPTALSELGVVISDRVAKEVEGIRRTLQGGFDRRAAALEQTIEAAKEDNRSILEQLRELETKDMTDEQRAQYLRKAGQDDRAAELQEYEASLDMYHRRLLVAGLAFDYKDYGITAEELQEIDSPEDMENYCLRKANSVLQERQDNPAPQQLGTAAADVITSAPTPAPATPPEPQVPAAARAASDIGSGGGGPQEPQPSTEKSPGALRENLKHTPWSDVRIRAN